MYKESIVNKIKGGQGLQYVAGWGNKYIIITKESRGENMI